MINRDFEILSEIEDRFSYEENVSISEILKRIGEVIGVSFDIMVERYLSIFDGGSRYCGGDSRWVIEEVKDNDVSTIVSSKSTRREARDFVKKLKIKSKNKKYRIIKKFFVEFQLTTKR